ncbi:YycH family regulatory protein [Paenibacillus sp. YYML68]|uniref:YycH family regulatory protein n=1 Tax=Paenibacillus sp. YYML68 TaxID=2909250 RepID=UPI00248F6EAE|nr:two-component system activity regulator YycH [Paenibacillus sp. YYML68]
MIEKLKTAALTLLVLLSLVQSYLLAYSYPQPEQPLIQEEYVKPELLGTQATLDDMLFPDHIVIHLGEGQHTVVYAHNSPYAEVLQTVKQRYLEGFRKTNMSSLSINWDEVRNKQPGVELRFRDGLPLTVLQQLLQIKGELPPEHDVITKIWIFAEDSSRVRTLLFTDTYNVVYEAKADFTTKDIEERFVSAAGSYMAYKPTLNDMYIPQKSYPMPSYTLGYTLMTVDQLKRTFFVDPALIRNLTERDGSEIYTDSKRGLQLKSGQHWMTYSDPVAPASDNRVNYLGNLLTAVQFINQHGGWNGAYGVQRMPERLLPGNQTYVFRQYYGSYPIVGTRDEQVGYMRITLQKDVVSGYERSTVLPDWKSVKRGEAELPGGELLEAMLQQYSKRLQIVSLFPAYRPFLSDKTMELVPKWAVELYDGTYEFLN